MIKVTLTNFMSMLKYYVSKKWIVSDSLKTCQKAISLLDLGKAFEFEFELK